MEQQVATNESCAISMVHDFDVLDSTSDWLLNRLQCNKPIDRHLCICKSQQKGRGQRNRIWESRNGRFATFSYGYRNADLNPALTLVCGITAVELINTQYHLNLKLKWPNDLMGTHGKVGGILVDSRDSNGFINYIVGMGVNIGFQTKPIPTFSGSIQPSSLEEEGLSLDLPFSELGFAKTICTAWHKNLNQLFNEGFSVFADRFNKLDQLSGRKVRLHEKNTGRTVTALGVAADGGYRIKDERSGESIIYSSASQLRPIVHL